jgi:hypothetical protein
MSGFMSGVHATAVGVGIAVSISASSGKPDSPATWVGFCIKAAEEAKAAVLNDPPYYPNNRERAKAMFAASLPAGVMQIFKDPAPVAMSGDDLTAAAWSAATAAFRCCMPQLTGRRAVQAYIACIAAGVQYKFLSGGDARALLYNAQLALAAFPSRRAARGRK